MLGMRSSPLLRPSLGVLTALTLCVLSASGVLAEWFHRHAATPALASFGAGFVVPLIFVMAAVLTIIAAALWRSRFS